MNDTPEIADIIRLLNAALDDTGERRQRLLEQDGPLARAHILVEMLERLSQAP